MCRRTNPAARAGAWPLVSACRRHHFPSVAYKVEIAKGIVMAKGQSRGNREPKKPKAAAKKPPAETITSKFQSPTKTARPKGDGK